MRVTGIPITFVNREKGKSKLSIKEIINFLFQNDSHKREDFMI